MVMGTAAADSSAGPAGSSPVRRAGGPARVVAAAARAVGDTAVEGLDAEEALSVVLAARHAAAAVFAVSAQALDRLARVYPETELDGSRYEDAAVVFELMAALGVPQRSAANELARGQELAALAGLCAALRRGTLDVPAARIILDAVRVLPPGLRPVAVQRLLDAHAAMPDGLTRSQLGRLLRRIVADLAPSGAEERQRDAVADRRVWHHAGAAAGDESTLGMTGPAERVALCVDTIDALARAILDHARRTRRPGHGSPASGDPDAAGPAPGGSATRPTGEPDAAGAAPSESAAGPAGPVCPPSATLEQARFDALDWLITGRTAESHPAWRAAHGAAADGDSPDGDDEYSGAGADDPSSRIGAEGADVVGPEPAGAATDDTGVAGRPGAEALANEWADADAEGADAAVAVATTDTEGADDAVAGVPSGGPGAAGRGWGDPGIFARHAARGGALGGPWPGSAPAEGCGCGLPRVSVVAQLTVSLSTLLGLDERPGELDGYGPVPASVARELAASATVWRRLLTDPVDGHLVTQAIRSYRPSAAMRRFVLARSNCTCAARGCTARSDLQIDHDTAWPHGPTSVTNTAPLHQPHHQGKTCGAWSHLLHPDTGELTQTSPLGRTCNTPPLPPLGGRLTGPPGRVSVRPAVVAELDRYRHRLEVDGTDPPGTGSRSALERHLTDALTGTGTGT